MAVKAYEEGFKEYPTTQETTSHEETQTISEQRENAENAELAEQHEAKSQTINNALGEHDGKEQHCSGNQVEQATCDSETGESSITGTNETVGGDGTGDTQTEGRTKEVIDIESIRGLDDLFDLDVKSLPEPPARKPKKLKAVNIYENALKGGTATYDMRLEANKAYLTWLEGFLDKKSDSAKQAIEQSGLVTLLHEKMGELESNVPVEQVAQQQVAQQQVAQQQVVQQQVAQQTQQQVVQQTQQQVVQQTQQQVVQQTQQQVVQQPVGNVPLSTQGLQASTGRGDVEFIGDYACENYGLFDGYVAQGHTLDSLIEAGCIIVKQAPATPAIPAIPAIPATQEQTGVKTLADRVDCAISGGVDPIDLLSGLDGDINNLDDSGKAELSNRLAQSGF